MLINVHPLFVHFPIGLLTLYAIFECVINKKIRLLPYWFYIKAILVIFGTLGSYAAYITGSFLEDAFNSPLLEVHQSFAVATVIVFSLLALSYLIQWVSYAINFGDEGKSIAKFVNYAVKMNRYVHRPPLLVPFSIFGLVVITITGALGAAIVYGPSIDPAVAFIYSLFF